MLRAERESDEGFDEVEAEMPAVITCAERVAQPVKVKPGASDEAETKPILVVRAGEIGRGEGIRTRGIADVGAGSSRRHDAEDRMQIYRHRRR